MAAEAIISSLGFPIGAFILMYQLVTKTLKENTRAIQGLCLVIERKMK